MPVNVAPGTPVRMVVNNVVGASGRAVSSKTVPIVPVPETGKVVARVPVKVPGTPVRIVI